MRQTTVLLMRQIYQHSAAPPTRLPRRRLRLLVCLAVLRATPWCRGPRASRVVAASASAPSRLPGGLEGDALVAASASAPSRLPGGLEGDALVQGAAASRPGLWDRALRMPVCRPIHSSYSWFPMRQATVPLLRRICQHSAAPPTRLPRVGVCAFSAAWRFEGDALGQAAVGVESGSDPQVAASASARFSRLAWRS
eukprot:tig00020912_g15877.t1